MPNKTSIQWTDYTSNPILARPIGDESVKIGWFCDKPDKDGGCLKCYAEMINKRFGNKLAFEKANRDKVEFFVKTNTLADLRRLNKTHPGAKVFVADMFDLFQPGMSYGHLVLLFNTFEDCSNLTLQFLTKYTARMAHFLTARYGSEIPKHFWMGMSAANQEWLMKNLVQLLHLQGTRFLSLEPLLGPINIKNYLGHIDWVIVGGESGLGARPCDIQWIRSIVKQCKETGTACFVKQLGANPVDSISDFGDPEGDMIFLDEPKGGDINEFPHDLRIREFPV